MTCYNETEQFFFCSTINLALNLIETIVQGKIYKLIQISFQPSIVKHEGGKLLQLINGKRIGKISSIVKYQGIECFFN